MPKDVTPEVLKKYREIAERVINNGKDLVGTQEQRRRAIDELLRRWGQPGKMTIRIDSMLGELLRRWVAGGETIRPGVSRADIHTFEDRFNVCLPADLRGYFLAIDGMSSLATDDELFHFCQLQEVQPVIKAFPDADVNAYSGYFVIAEFSLWAHVYAIRLSTNDDCPVAVVA